MQVPRWAVRTGKAVATASVVVGILLLPLTLWQAADFASQKGWLWRALGDGGRRFFAPLLESGSELSVVLVFAGVVLFGYLVVVDRQRWRADLRAPEVREPGQKPPDIKPDATAPRDGSLLKAQGTNDTPWPRVESAVDSFGHKPKRVSTDSFYAATDYVLRPGQQVTFELEASDPNGDDLQLSVITPAGSKANVVISGGIVTWNVREEDIADPAYVHIYLASQRNFHRVSTYDDAVSFVYRVLPRL